MSTSVLDACWRGAWKPPEKLLPSEWAEKYFYLPRKGNAEPGRFRFARTPYLRGIVDAFAETGVEEIVFVKPTRVGGTTAGQIILGYWVDNDPGDCLTVMPSEAAVEEEVKDRVRPIFDNSDALRSHLSPRPHDNTLSAVRLDSMTLYFGWAGSPQSLASKTCRYVRFDEVDKYPPFAGREADPISLGRERSGTFLHRRRHYITSTPTIRDGAIWRAFEACGDRRYYHVPCPHCGAYQQLTWPQVKWPHLDITDKVKRGDEIETNKLAWYECVTCAGRIEENHKPRMLERGQWVSQGQRIANDGTMEGARPVSKRVGFHLSSLYSPWRSNSEMASEFIRAAGDVALTMNFRNSRLGEPFEVQVSKTEPSKIRDKSKKGGPAGVIPEWAVILIATADVQADRFYYVVRAWGYEFHSQLLRYGVVPGKHSWDALKRETLLQSFVFDGGRGACFPERLVIDSQYRKDEVDDFARTDPMRINTARGLATYFGPIAEGKLDKAGGVFVWNINTMQSKDKLSQLMDDENDRWLPHQDVSDEYCSQVTAEHKVINPQTKREEWKQKSAGAANHYFDCEAMQCAIATRLGAGFPKPTESAASAPADESESLGSHLRTW